MDRDLHGLIHRCSTWWPKENSLASDARQRFAQTCYRGSCFASDSLLDRMSSAHNYICNLHRSLNPGRLSFKYRHLHKNCLFLLSMALIHLQFASGVLKSGTRPHAIRTGRRWPRHLLYSIIIRDRLLFRSNMMGRQSGRSVLDPTHTRRLYFHIPSHPWPVAK